MAIRGLRYRAVLLDALGTLVELEPPAPRLRAELSRRFGLTVSLPTAEQAIAAEISYYRRHLDEGRDPATLGDLRRRCAGVLSRELARRLDDELPPVEAMTEALLASLSFRAFDDVGPALRTLRELNLRVVVVSNWDASLAGVLDRLGLTPWLDGVLTSAQAGARKPSPRIFKLGLELTGARAGEAVHVGDSPAEDVVGARAAGIEAVLIDRPGPRRGVAGPPGTVRTIQTLAELPPLLAGPD